ncbi:MAG: hypothetical protein M3O70_03370 [Actinomycetota bacterium]|nr:hypothetical protein [Actinomycetota bacterium]
MPAWVGWALMVIVPVGFLLSLPPDSRRLPELAPAWLRSVAERGQRLSAQGRPREQFVAAVRAAHAGDAMLDPGITRRLMVHFAAKLPRRRSHRMELPPPGSST